VNLPMVGAWTLRLRRSGLPWCSLDQPVDQHGFFGLSEEDINTQRKYLETVPVRYPLLTVGAGGTKFL